MVITSATRNRVVLLGHVGSNPTDSATGATPSSRNPKKTCFVAGLFFVLLPKGLRLVRYKGRIQKRFSDATLRFAIRR